MTIPYPYAVIDSFESLNRGVFVWHPLKGEGVVTNTTPTHLIVFFYETADISKIKREDVIEQMGHIR